jgi:hypothetical protein
LASDSPLVSVVVYARQALPTLAQTLTSLECQHRLAQLEVLLADGSPDGAQRSLAGRFPWLRYLPLPRANMPALKAAAIAAARAEIIAILDPVDAATPTWIDEILLGLADEQVGAVGGTVVLDGPATAANQAAYLFEYGAFNPPVQSGPTQGDLPGNNVAYRRSLLVEQCADILREEGFNKPFVHQRLRALGTALVIRPSMRVRHLSDYRFVEFVRRCCRFGRCFGATRWRRSAMGRRALYAVCAPGLPVLLMGRQLARALGHRANRRALPRAGLALLAVCASWGLGEWLGYWFGPGYSCQELY